MQLLTSVLTIQSKYSNQSFKSAAFFPIPNKHSGFFGSMVLSWLNSIKLAVILILVKLIFCAKSLKSYFVCINTYRLMHKNENSVLKVFEEQSR